MKKHNRLRCATALLAAMMAHALTAQTTSRLINDGWRFTRLNDQTVATMVGTDHQGSDWQSQFSIQHVSTSSVNSRLALSDSLINAEASQLATKTWQQVNLPHTAYIEPLTIVHPWQGVCYYQRTLTIAPKEANQQLLLEFEAAMQLCDIWINGQHAAQHAGGFTTFVVDATKYLHKGDNTIVVRLDNRDNPLVPPGKPLADLDFCYHSGIYRDVRLITKPAIQITHPLLANKVAGGGVFVTTPQVSDKESVVNIQTEVANTTTMSSSLQLRQSIYPWSRGKNHAKAVAQTTLPIDLASNTTHTFSQQLHIDNPHLWSPDSPALYVVKTEIIDGKKVVDCQTTRIGIRHIEVKPEGCFINGKRYELDGSNRHQEYPYVGNALSDQAQRRDMVHIRQNGFNTVRLGHYPQDPSVLDACDELGLLAIEPIPGWQYYNSDSTFVNLTYYNIQELIRRDRNHPCILMWETTLNESWPPKQWKDGAVATAHAEMPKGLCITSGDTYGYDGFDVCYNDWSDKNFNRPNTTTKPSFIREYYDYEFGGHYSTSRIGRKDGERHLRQNLWNAQWSHNSNRLNSLNTMGGAVWSMYDYNRGYADNICESGLADIFRLPKYSLYYYRLQTPKGAYTPSGPMPYEMFVASRWDSESSDTIVVLGNVAQVELFVNGKSVGRQSADHGPSTKYTPTTNLGNCEKVAFPPFTFTGVKFSAGTLQAVGFDKQGAVVAQASVRTPQAPKELRLSYFESKVPAARHDLFIVYATMIDANGTPCHTNDTPVTISAEGGTIVGPSTFNTQDGVASFLVQTSDAKQLRLTATSPNLTTATLKLKLSK